MFKTTAIYDIDPEDIAPNQEDVPVGNRFTKFKCFSCEQYLTVKELSSIRNANAPCKHYTCLGQK